MQARFAASAAVLAVVVAACSDQPPPTSPSVTSVRPSPLAVVSDGARRGGNPDFFFLPPLQPSPRKSPNFKPGGFNPNLSPTVKICDGRDLTAGECTHPLLKNGQPVVFTAVRGWDGLPDWVDPEQYHVLWQTRNYNLVLGNPYRILVKVGSTLLGYLDLVPANRLLGALRISAGGQDIGWLDNWIVPIRFRIEKGALCADPQDCTEFSVGTAGGNFTVPSRHAALAVPAGAVKRGDNVTVVIERESPQYDGECLPTDLVQSKGCYHFRSEPPLYQFATNVRMEACVDVQALTPAQQDQLLLYKYNETEGLVQLPQAAPTLINCTGFTAMAKPAASPSVGFAAAALRRLGRFAERFLGPQPLYAAMFAGVPKGLGGLGGSFSDVGGAVPGEEEGAPDLTMDGLIIQPAEPDWWKNLTVTVTVYNDGATSTGAFQVGFELWKVPGEEQNPVLVRTIIVGNDPLAPGGQRTIATTIPCVGYGSGSNAADYFIVAKADYSNVVYESDETNNELTSPWFYIGSAGSGGSCGS